MIHSDVRFRRVRHGRFELDDLNRVVLHNRAIRAYVHALVAERERIREMAQRIVEDLGIYPEADELDLIWR